MKKLPLLITPILFLTLCMMSCTQEELRTTLNCEADTTINPVITDLTCDEDVSLELIARWTIPVGTVTVSRQDDILSVEYITTSDRVMTSSSLYVGPCEGIPFDENCEPRLENFPFQEIHDPAVTNHKYEVLITGQEDCFCLVAQATTELPVDGGQLIYSSFGVGGNDLPGNQWGDFAIICSEDCAEDTTSVIIGGEDPCFTNEGDFRTQTQGGWGTTPSGNNPGVYLHEHFDNAFPDGLKMGCNYTLTLTSPEAVTQFLPQGGTPVLLGMNYVDPINASLSVLAGNLTAVMLAVGFDNYDPDFGASESFLGDLILTDGAFEGWTVSALVEEANLSIGGCSGDYSYSSLNDALAGISQTFVDGENSTGFLACPE